MKRLLCIMTASLLLVSYGFGQTRQAIVRIAPFTGTGIASSEASMLEKLVGSYVVELKTFRVIDAQGQDSALRETEMALGLGSSPASEPPLIADYIVSGTIGKIGDIFVFSLDNTRVSSGEKLSVSDTAQSISDIVLRSRNLTWTLFGAKPLPADAGTNKQPDTSIPSSVALKAIETVAIEPQSIFRAPTISDLLGTWRGDKGLETIRLFPNATALAILSGGGTLKLRVSISEDIIEIAQDQPNDVAMYRAASVSLDLARRIAAEARPMRWLYTLSADGTTLSGTKESIAISGSGDTLWVDNDYVRSASWVRISR